MLARRINPILPLLCRLISGLSVVIISMRSKSSLYSNPACTSLSCTSLRICSTYLRIPVVQPGHGQRKILGPAMAGRRRLLHTYITQGAHLQPAQPACIHTSILGIPTSPKTKTMQTVMINHKDKRPRLKPNPQSQGRKARKTRVI